MHGTPLSPLITPPAPRVRQNRQALRMGLAVVGGVVLTLFVVWRLGSKHTLTRAPVERPIPEATVMGTPSAPSTDLRMVTSYNRLPVAKADPIPVASTPDRTPTPPVTSRQPTRAIPPATPGRPPTDPPKPGATLRPPPGAAGGSPRQAATQARPEGRPAQPERWFSAIIPPQGDVLAPPFPEDPVTAESEARAASKLFPKAVWERPLDPTKVLYADQVVQGVLMQNVNSDIPGTVRIKVTEPVMDRWGLGHTLIPADTTFLGKQDGQANFGQEVLPINVKMAIFPNGTAVGWNNGQVGDATGAAGLPANVDNHYRKLFAGIAASVLLNVGVRAPFGSTSDFQPNLPQEFAQQGAQGANQAGRDIIRRQFAVRPTLTQQWAYPVTLQFSENVSFQSAIVIIKK